MRDLRESGCYCENGRRCPVPPPGGGRDVAQGCPAGRGSAGQSGHKRISTDPPHCWVRKTGVFAMSTLIVGVDLATAHFELALADRTFAIQSRKRLTRTQFAQFSCTLPPSLFLMEAGSSAHYWARTLQD